MSKGTYEVTGTVSAVADAPALRGVVLGRLLRGRRRPATSATRTTRAAPARWRSTRSRRSPTPTRTSRGPTTTSRTRATSTATATCSSPTACSTTSCVVHAGADQADDGGEQGTYAEWSSARPSTRRPAATRSPGTGFKVFNFTTQPEDAGVGVIAHEYGHDLGLPDLYDVDRPGDTDVALLGPDEHRLALRPAVPDDPDAHGRVEQVRARLDRPAGAGRTAPQQRDGHARPGLAAADGHRGRGAGQPARQAVDARRAAQRRERLVVQQRPERRRRPADPLDRRPGGRATSGSGRGTTTRSRSCGTTASSRSRPTAARPGRSSRSTTRPATVVSTDEDPNGNLEAYFGGLENGLTGDSGGYRHDYVDLTPYAGTTIQLRLRYATDAAFEERGWFADDFSLTADGTEVWTDDVESGDERLDRRGRHVHRHDGRRLDHTTGHVRLRAVLPGGVAQLRRLRQGPAHAVRRRTSSSTASGTSTGRRTTRRACCSGTATRRTRSTRRRHHVRPAEHRLQGPAAAGRRALRAGAARGAAAEANPSLLDNLNSRARRWTPRSARSGATRSGPASRRAETDPYDLSCNWFGPAARCSTFTDAKTWYPGLEYRPDLDPEAPLFFRDVDASMVVPSRGNEIYSTRIVDAGRPARARPVRARSAAGT